MNQTKSLTQKYDKKGKVYFPWRKNCTLPNILIFAMQMSTKIGCILMHDLDPSNAISNI